MPRRYQEGQNSESTISRNVANWAMIAGAALTVTGFVGSIVYGFEMGGELGCNASMMGRDPLLVCAEAGDFAVDGKSLALIAGVVLSFAGGVPTLIRRS